MAPERFGKQILMTILPAADPFAIASAMLQQQDFAGQATDPPHFLERGDRIGKCTGRERRDHRIETFVAKRKVFRVRDHKHNMHR